VLFTAMPRRRPSDEPSAMVRTTPSPSCCCTSTSDRLRHPSGWPRRPASARHIPWASRCEIRCHLPRRCTERTALIRAHLLSCFSIADSSVPAHRPRLRRQISEVLQHGGPGRCLVIIRFHGSTITAFWHQRPTAFIATMRATARTPCFRQRPDTEPHVADSNSSATVAHPVRRCSPSCRRASLRRSARRLVGRQRQQLCTTASCFMVLTRTGVCQIHRIHFTPFRERRAAP
jgi:hypothetical protein